MLFSVTISYSRYTFTLNTFSELASHCQTCVGGKADRPDGVGDGHTVVEAQDGDVVVKVEVAEVSGSSAQHEARLRLVVGSAAIVLAKSHFDHEPHESRYPTRPS